MVAKPLRTVFLTVLAIVRMTSAVKRKRLALAAPAADSDSSSSFHVGRKRMRAEYEDVNNDAKNHIAIFEWAHEQWKITCQEFEKYKDEKEKYYAIRDDLIGRLVYLKDIKKKALYAIERTIP